MYLNVEVFVQLDALRRKCVSPRRTGKGSGEGVAWHDEIGIWTVEPNSHDVVSNTVGILVGLDESHRELQWLGIGFQKDLVTNP